MFNEVDDAAVPFCDQRAEAQVLPDRIVERRNARSACGRGRRAAPLGQSASPRNLGPSSRRLGWRDTGGLGNGPRPAFWFSDAGRSSEGRERCVGFEMPKRSNYAIALGLHGPPDPENSGGQRRPDRQPALRSLADGFYFQLESFLDGWRRSGLREDVVRDALDRARRTSVAMEQVGQLLTDR